MNCFKTGNVLMPLFAFHAMLAGCDTRRERFDDEAAWVRVEIDWRQAGICPEGVSIYVFEQETGKKFKVLHTNEMRADSVTVDSLNLHIGRYSLLVFNETERSHSNVSFRGTSYYHTFEACTWPVAKVVTPNVLAAAHVDAFEVTCEMTGRRRTCPPLLLVPKRLNAIAEVTVHVKSLHYLHVSEQEGALSGLIEGVFLAAEAPGAASATHYFTLNGRAFYQGSSTDGILKGTLVIFGAATAPSENILSLRLLLRDMTECLFERNLSGKLPGYGDLPKNHLKFEVGLGTADDPPIEITRAPDNNANGIFQVKVDEWGESISMDVLVDIEGT
ncbi:MAG: DUF5119 domain-containing protein [Prevotellaceae bacterium]|nr:DUF5119 domain-containing protein [Prevotellaceae bacterium]